MASGYNRPRRGGGTSRGNSRGRGRQQHRGGASRSSVPVILGYKALEKLRDKDPDDIVLDLGSERCFPAFQTLLANVELSKGMVELIVEVLAKTCDSNSPQFFTKLLVETPKSLFVILHLKTHLTRLSANKDYSMNPQRFLENTVRLFSEILKKIPNAFESLPLGDLDEVVMGLRDISDDLKEKAKQLRLIKDESLQKVRRRAELEKQRRNPSLKIEEEVGPPPNNFREMTIIPEKDDIYTTKMPYLRKNIVKGRYEDLDHYLDVQFRLLREDFLRPLRQGINDLVTRGMDERRGVFRDIRIYRNVKILHPECSNRGLLHQIEFDTTRLKRVRWENSKRLIFGSLLCLSKDNFQTFFFATVANRDPQELVHGNVTVQFIRTTHDTQDFSRTNTYQMVETTAYFESYNPILKGLQQTEAADLPFQTYLVECNKEIGPPKYLEHNRFMESAPTFDFTSILDKKSEQVARKHLIHQLRGLSILDRSSSAEMFKHVPVVEASKWPSREDLGLDESQYNALLLALTKEVAVIQGPPGTGKTYLGLKIAKILLSNKEKWIQGEERRVRRRREVHSTPILVICYTNHALDQFLEGIYDFHGDGNDDNKIVRIGGRSKSEKLKECNLNAIKYRTHDTAPSYVRKGMFDVHRKLDDVNAKMEKSSKVLQKCWAYIITEQTLQQSGVILEEHFRSLLRPFIHLGESMPEQGTIVLEWLNLATLEMEKEEENIIDEKPVTFGGRRGEDSGRFECDAPLAGNDFSLCVNVKTEYPGCIVCSSSTNGMWTENSKILLINDAGLVQFVAGELSILESYTSVRDDKWHEIAIVYQHDSKRFALFVDKRMECSAPDVFLPMDEKSPGFEVGYALGSPPYRLRNFVGKMKEFVYYRSAKYNEKVMADAEVEYEIDFMQEQRKLEDEDHLFEELLKSRRSRRADDFRVVFPSKLGKSFGGWQTQMKKNVNFEVKKQLRIDDVMTDAEASRYEDVWQLAMKDRWRLYRKWVRDISQQHQNTITSIQEEYDKGMKELEELRNAQSYELLKEAHVIGMTTTGAAKYRELLHRIKPRITIVEEAAEVLESHIVTALTGGCEHLILIGDHQQLRPKPTVFKLGLDYKLDISLFERMVTNGMPFARLDAQHRMRPEISIMMDHIYENLNDHESVLNFEHIMGVNKDIYFINHSVKEDDVDENQSHSNAHEARFIGSLCNYLLQQGYSPSKITVLTPYTGQLLQLKKFVPKLEGLRISVVDNFQGEENDIILLSLVRSQDMNGKEAKDIRRLIGFLGIDNRVCVSLSRAKKGFFCIGNLDLMTSANDLWSNILNDMERRGSVGDALPLACQNHPATITHVKSATDFNKVPNGGCSRPCQARLTCGHRCEQLCHPTDPEHLEYDCRKACTRKCQRGHPCSRMCYQDCADCMVLVPKLIESCRHNVMMPCYQDPNKFCCPEPCPVLRPCGHRCPKRCGNDCGPKCFAKVEKTWPICGHVNETKCYVNPDFAECSHPCEALLKCEHPCSGTCGGCKQGRLHQPCSAKCGRVRFCDHVCEVPCTKNCPPCLAPCPNKCPHSECNKPCGDPCVECKERCDWRCKHYSCKRLCGEPCDRPRCNRRCEKTLKKCRHRCAGLCGDLCPKLCKICDKKELTEIFFGNEDERDAKFVELVDCGHVFEVTGMDKWMDMQEKELKKGQSTSIQMIKCPKCNMAIRKSSRYGNIIKSILRDIEDVKRAIEFASTICKPDEFKRRIKNEMAHANLEYVFPAEAVEIQAKLSRKLTKDVQNIIENQVQFLKFIRKLKEIIKSVESTRYQSSRSVTGNTKVSDDETDFLEKEVDTLVEWVMEERIRFSQQELEDFNDELMRTWIMFTYKALNIARERKNILFTNSLSKECIDYVRRMLESEKKLSENAKEQCIKNLEYVIEKHPSLNVRYATVTEAEKKMIVKVMGFQQGHWFKCPKGHVYCIGDCGGAMVEAKCPECGSKIGGTQHRLLSDNSLASDMDGARFPAWSDTANNMGNWNFDE